MHGCLPVSCCLVLAVSREEVREAANSERAAMLPSSQLLPRGWGEPEAAPSVRRRQPAVFLTACRCTDRFQRGVTPSRGKIFILLGFLFERTSDAPRKV